jgi:hypothetical protein
MAQTRRQVARYCWHCGHTRICERSVWWRPHSPTADVKFTCPEGHVWWEDEQVGDERHGDASDLFVKV